MCKHRIKMSMQDHKENKNFDNKFEKKQAAMVRKDKQKKKRKNADF